jgi:hypothetical protein
LPNRFATRTPTMYWRSRAIIRRCIPPLTAGRCKNVF